MINNLVGMVVIPVLAAHSAFSHTWWQEIPFFYALMGFLASALLILIANGLCRWLNRAENYYERGDVL